MSKGIFRSAGRPVVISHAVVGTISLTSALIIYDGWATLRFGDVVAIIAGIVLAIFIARVFAESLAGLAAKGDPLKRTELLGVVKAECGFLLLAVPPIVLLAVLDLAGVALGDSIQVVIWLGPPRSASGAASQASSRPTRPAPRARDSYRLPRRRASIDPQGDPPARKGRLERGRCDELSANPRRATTPPSTLAFAASSARTAEQPAYCPSPNSPRATRSIERLPRLSAPRS